ncbi:MAG TPA: addiction module protein [Blastocatellia bacterium]|jgi:putative addiction module component (TIGR02574 family)
MSTQFDQVEADAMKLPPKERVRLAQRLASSLDDEIETGVEALWFDEAERRLQELHTGNIEGIDSEEAFSKARKALDR